MKPLDLHLLLIEDNTTDALLLAQYLQEADRATFTLTHVQRLGEGLEALTAGSFDAILLDLSLPDESGMDTLHRVYQAAPETPIVVLTGMDDQELPFQALRAGAQDFVTKETMAEPALEHALLCAVQRHRANDDGSVEAGI